MPKQDQKKRELWEDRIKKQFLKNRHRQKRRRTVGNFCRKISIKSALEPVLFALTIHTARLSRVVLHLGPI